MDQRLRRTRFVSLVDGGEDCFFATLPGTSERLSLSSDMLAIWQAAPRLAFISRSELIQAIPSDVQREHGAAALGKAIDALLEMGLFQGDQEPIGYDRVADIYDDRPPCSPAVIDIIRAHSTPAHRKQILEVGCGTGTGLELLAKLKPEALYGIDLSRDMLSRAEQRLRGLKIRWQLQEARAELLPFEGESMTMIAVVQALHWFNAPLFWSEARRVLTPQNRLAIVTRYPVVSDDNPVSRFISGKPWGAIMERGPLAFLFGLPAEGVGIHRVEHFVDPIRVESLEQARNIALGFHNPFRNDADVRELEPLLKRLRRVPFDLPCVTSVGILELLPLPQRTPPPKSERRARGDRTRPRR